MTKLEAVFERLRALPEPDQEAYADWIEDVLEEEAAFRLTEDQRRTLAARRGRRLELVAEAEMEAFLADRSS